MSDLQIRGPIIGGSGTPVPLTAGLSGAQRVQDAHGRYMEAVRRGKAFYQSIAGAAITAFVGAAGGTPAVGLYNPPNSGMVAWILGAMIANRVAATAAGTVTWALWGGPTAAVTGTNSPGIGLASLASGGSSMRAVVNAAMTGSTALGLIMPLSTYYWATAASAFVLPGFLDIGGMVAVYPGNLVALGGSAALTTATWDASLVWEEVELLP